MDLTQNLTNSPNQPDIAQYQTKSATDKPLLNGTNRHRMNTCQGPLNPQVLGSSPRGRTT